MTRSGNSLEGERVAAALVPQNYFKAGQQGGEAMRAFNQWAAPGTRAAMQDYVFSQARAAAAKGDGLDIDKLTTWARQRRPA